MVGVCGRDCGDCELRRDFACKGCLETEGHPVWGKCRVVSCCHGRGLQNCEACPSAANCGAAQEMRWQRDSWPEEEARRQRQEAERQVARRERMAQKAPILAKGLLILFWMMIADMGLNLIGKLELGTGVDLVLNLLSLAAGVVVLVSYWKFSKLSERFRMVFLWEAVSVGALVVLVVLMLLGGNELNGLLAVSAVLVIGVMILGVVIIYEFCQGMWEMLDGEDQHLADNWLLLRKWTLGSMMAVILFGVLTLILSIFGVLLMLGAALVLVGCSIAQLVLTWQSARFFREEMERTALPPAEI